MVLRDIRKANVKGKKVLVRVDYNIALDRQGRPRDVSRMVATVPTLLWLRAHGAAIIIVSHRGRPTKRGAKDSLQPMVEPLGRLLKTKVQWLADPIWSAGLMTAINTLPSGAVALLENIRFDPGEGTNSPRLAKRLASFGDLLVNDAFSDSHRAHASIVGVAKHLPAYAGLQVQAEVAALSTLLKNPPRPYVAVLGGSKISTKLHLVRALLEQADHVLIGGALANTILQAEGLAIGRSLSEPKMLSAARGLSVSNKHLEIPCDVVVASRPTATAARRIRPVGRVGPDDFILDIGPDTIDMYERILGIAKTIVWNGPMGYYEVPAFAKGTDGIAKAIGRSRAKSYVGGGETIDALQRLKLTNRVTWSSTGGGAMLEFLEGKHLPGLTAVQA